MRVLDIVETIVDGPHLRTSIYFAGCKHHCAGCHNPETWDFNQGTKYTVDELLSKVEEFGNKYVTLSGGDPYGQDPCELLEFVKELHNRGCNIWVYTGYVIEHLPQNQKFTLPYIDVLVDGPFIEELKNLSLKWRGSSNQRLIDVQEFLKQNKVVLYED